jgi:hypothetical protein
MKIVIKELNPNGNDLLVYLMTNDDVAINCNLIIKKDLNRLIEKISNGIKDLPQINYSYKQYIKQDER